MLTSLFISRERYIYIFMDVFIMDANSSRSVFLNNPSFQKGRKTIAVESFEKIRSVI